MLVVEKAHHIEANITGAGTEIILNLIKANFPKAEILRNPDEVVHWNTSDLSKEIKAEKTPGKLLKAYRARAGLSVVELADAAETKYPNISAMENDRRTIGLKMAKKLGMVLKVDYIKFLA
jgi:DNA-binding XRE family transcriptional regulator